VINDREVHPSGDYVDALKAYGIKTFMWSQRDGMVAEVGSN
jgi:hypothetical protein